MLSVKPDHKHQIINNTAGDIGYKGFRLGRNKSVLVEEITPVIQELIDNKSVSVLDYSEEVKPEAEKAAVVEAPKVEAAKEEIKEAPKAPEPAKFDKPNVTTNVKTDAPKLEQKDNRK